MTTKGEKNTKKDGKSEKKEVRSRSFMLSLNEKYVPDHLRDFHLLNALIETKAPRGTLWAGIWHDKDVYTEENVSGGSSVGDRKPNHLHLSLYFPSAKTLSAVKKLLDLEDIGDNFIQVFKGSNAKQNLFSYLTHRTEGAIGDGKYQYAFSELSANFDYDSYVTGITNTLNATSLEKATIQEQIFNGQLRFIDFVMNDRYSTFYLNNKTFVMNCIDTLYKRKMNDRDREKITVVYIQGEQGSGKSNYAKAYALKNYRDYCISSSQNDVAQDYLGQDAMIFDDARPGDFNASEWLKLLDPYNNESTVNSRYYNKYLAVKCIILTSVTPFEDFFVYAPKKESGDWSEPVGQFMRRFDFVLHATKREEQDILSSDIAIYKIEPKSWYKTFPKGPVNYRHKLSDKPVKTFNHFIARLNPVGSDELLSTF